MEREFQIHFKPNRFHTIGQTEDRFGGGYHLSTNVFLAVKTLKAAGCSEI